MSGSQGSDAATTAPGAAGGSGLAAAVRKRPLALAVGGAIAVLVIGVGILTPRYETNDDATMHLIACGRLFSDQPDEHLMFSNVLIGLALRSLYTSAPDVPWYPLYQFVTLAAAATAIVYALLRVNPSPRQAAVCALVLAVVFLPSVVELQFTKTAFLATFAGIVLLLAPLRGAGAWPRLADAAAVVLLIWGSLIRFESFALAFVVAAPVALLAVVAAGLRPAARRAVPLAVAVAAAAGLHWYNQAYYARSAGWEDFYAYNAARAEFTDYDRYKFNDQTRKPLQEAGWEGIDLGMMINFFYADRDRYSLERLQRIIATVPRKPPRGQIELFQSLVHNLSLFPQVMVIFLAVPCGACLTVSSWRELLLPASLWAYGFAVSTLLATFFWLPARVVVPIFAGVLVSASLRPERAAGGGRDTWGPTSARAVRAIAGAAAALVTLWAAAVLVTGVNRDAKFHEAARRVVAFLEPNRDKLFVLWREMFPLEKYLYPLDNTRNLRDFRCVSLGVLLPTPITDRQLQEFGITDLYRALWERENLYLVAIKPLLEYFQIYVAQHYHVDLEFRTLFSTETAPPFIPRDPTQFRFNVYHLRQRNAPPPERPAEQPR